MIVGPYIITVLFSTCAMCGTTMFENRIKSLRILIWFQIRKWWCFFTVCLYYRSPIYRRQVCVVDARCQNGWYGTWSGRNCNVATAAPAERSGTSVGGGARGRPGHTPPTKRLLTNRNGRARQRFYLYTHAHRSSVRSAAAAQTRAPPPLHMDRDAPIPSTRRRSSTATTTPV